MYYKLGDILRLTRKSLKMTQEKLSWKGGSVQTISRVENGTQKVSRKTFDKLMQRMDRSHFNYAAMLSGYDESVFNTLDMVEYHLSMNDYVKAEEILCEIEDKLNSVSLLSKQYLIHIRGIIKYRTGKINVDDYLHYLKEAIKITIPQYGIVSLTELPMTKDEVNIVMNISTVYAESGNKQHALKILYEIKENIERRYMDNDSYFAELATIIRCIVKWLGQIGEHESAIKNAEEGLKVCKMNHAEHIVPNFLYAIAWNMEKQINKGIIDKETAEKACLLYLKQAFYICKTINYKVMEDHIRKHCEEYYGYDVFATDFLYDLL